MKWSGSIASFLNHLVDRMGLSWEFRDNTVVIMRYVTEFHEIAALPGSVQYSLTTGGTASGQSGSNNAGTNATAGLDVSEKGAMDPLATIEKAVAEMISTVAGSSVTRSEGSGRLVVKTSREMQAQVREFIRSENAAMLRQAQIQFEIFSVTTDTADERGIDWSLALARLDGVARFGLRSPATLTGTSAGGLSAAILPGVAGSTTSARWGGSEAFLQALSQIGYSAQHRPVSLLTLNRSWARKSRLTSEGYLAETVPGVATSTGAGTPGLKTDTFTVGDQYVALPQILDDNSVLLKFGISLSDLLGLFDVSVGQGETLQKVQTPRITSVNDQYTVALRPGEVLVLTGLSREVAANDQRTLAEGMSVGFGGSRKVSVKREHFIVFVRPVIL
jgi:type IVB pilus formation R64 PilN family outer membrane protein